MLYRGYRMIGETSNLRIFLASYLEALSPVGATAVDGWLGRELAEFLHREDKRDTRSRGSSRDTRCSSQ